MNNPITKKLALSRDVIFDEWSVGYHHVFNKQKDDEGPSRIIKYEKTKPLKPNKRTSWNNFNMKFLNPHALLNQPISCAIHHHNWTQEALEDHFLHILKGDNAGQR
jgi:hypothetical protein